MTSGEEWTPMDRKTAESLLRGDRTGLPLDRVLSAARGPASAGELAGEAAAVAAFRAAAGARGRPVRRFSIFRSALTRPLTVKVVAAAFATTATVGGVALAANTGARPAPVSAPAASVPASPSPSPSVAPSVSPSVSVSVSVSRSRPAGSPSAAPDRIADLCREFSRRNRENRRRALDDDRFGELIRQAGDKDRDRVERYCGARPGGSAGNRPDREGDRKSSSRPRSTGSMTPRRE
ncbi:hypothetical protein [Actinoplanes sp. NPDC049802]|uniref:hypothetical protein n=1 Tax=Actinoplanes sp. NPDC049802 TaxID=3154742 RepID=UPI0033EF4F10